MGTFKMSATIVQYAICTTAAVCAAAGSCCSNFASTSGGTSNSATAGTTVCWNAGTAVNASGVIPVVSPIPSGMVVATLGYLSTACPAVATGSSTLAVSAAVAATAVYMM